MKIEYKDFNGIVNITNIEVGDILYKDYKYELTSIDIDIPDYIFTFRNIKQNCEFNYNEEQLQSKLQKGYVILSRKRILRKSIL